MWLLCSELHTATGCAAVEVSRVALREEGVAEVALKRWRMVLRLGK